MALVSDMEKVRALAHDVVLVEPHLVVVVLNGHASFCVGDQQVQMQRGDILLCKPMSILESSMLSMDLEIRGFVVASDFAEDLMKDTKLSWTLRAIRSNHDSLHATDEELNRICRYYDLLTDKLNAPDTTSKPLALNALCTALIYEFCDIFEHNDMMLQNANYSSSGNIFQRFIKLLEDPAQPFLSVNEYASLLHITPKYFSTVCKKVSGKTANEIIKEEIIKQARILLRDSSLSIKQVADRLNFANQSHFGTFFRRNAGVSPQQFRAS